MAAVKYGFKRFEHGMTEYLEFNVNDGADKMIQSLHKRTKGYRTAVCFHVKLNGRNNVVHPNMLLKNVKSSRGRIVLLKKIINSTGFHRVVEQREASAADVIDVCAMMQRGTTRLVSRHEVFKRSFYSECIANNDNKMYSFEPEDVAIPNCWNLSNLELRTDRIFSQKRFTSRHVHLSSGGTLSPLQLRQGYLGCIDYMYKTQYSNPRYFLILDAQSVPAITEYFKANVQTVGKCEMHIIHDNLVVDVETLEFLNINYSIVVQNPGEVIRMPPNCVFQSYETEPMISIRRNICYQGYEDSARLIKRCHDGCAAAKSNETYDRYLALYANERLCTQRRFPLTAGEYADVLQTFPANTQDEFVEDSLLLRPSRQDTIQLSAADEGNHLTVESEDEIVEDSLLLETRLRYSTYLLAAEDPLDATEVNQRTISTNATGKELDIGKDSVTNKGSNLPRPQFVPVVCSPSVEDVLQLPNATEVNPRNTVTRKPRKPLADKGNVARSSSVHAGHEQRRGPGMKAAIGNARAHRVQTTQLPATGSSKGATNTAVNRIMIPDVVPQHINNHRKRSHPCEDYASESGEMHVLQSATIGYDEMLSHENEYNEDWAVTKHMMNLTTPWVTSTPMSKTSDLMNSTRNSTANTVNSITFVSLIDDSFPNYVEFADNFKNPVANPNSKNIHYHKGKFYDANKHELKMTVEHAMELLTKIERKREIDRTTHKKRDSSRKSGKNVDKCFMQLSKNASKDKNNPKSIYNRLFEQKNTMESMEFYGGYFGTWYGKRLLYRTLVAVTSRDVLEKYVFMVMGDYLTFIFNYINPDDEFSMFWLYASLRKSIDFYNGLIKESSDVYCADFDVIKEYFEKTFKSVKDKSGAIRIPYTDYVDIRPPEIFETLLFPRNDLILDS